MYIIRDNNDRYLCDVSFVKNEDNTYEYYGLKTMNGVTVYKEIGKCRDALNQYEEIIRKIGIDIRLKIEHINFKKQYLVS